MNNNSFHARPTRRRVLGLGAAAGAAMLGARPGTVFAQAKVPGDLEPEVVFASNGGIQQKLFEEKFFPEFKQLTGVTATYLPGQPSDNVAKVRAQKNDPTIDVMWVAGASTYDAIEEKLVVPLDLSRLPNYTLTRDQFKDEELIATIGLSGCGMITNTDRFASENLAEPTSWLEMWDPKFKGHVGLYSINVTCTVGMVALMADQLTGSHKDMKNIEAAIAKFKELTPNVLAYYPTSGSWETAMQQGDLWIGGNTFTRAVQMKQAGMPVGFPRPKEGRPAWASGAGVVADCKHPNAAHAFIDYMLSTGFQQQLPATIGYGPINRDAKVPDELALYFPPAEDLFVPDWRFLSAHLSEIVDLWNREVER